MTLTFPDLSALSGYKRPGDVRKWLKRNGVSFMLDKAGRPVTTQEALNRAMLPARTRTRPDFSEFEAAPEMPRQPRRDLLRSSEQVDPPV